MLKTVIAENYESEVPMPEKNTETGTSYQKWINIREIDHPTIQYGIPAYAIPKAKKI